MTYNSVQNYSGPQACVVQIVAVQSIPVAIGLPGPVRKAFAVQYLLYFILTLVPGIKISIHGFPPQASMTSGRCLYQRNVLRNYTDLSLSMSVGNIDS